MSIYKSYILKEKEDEFRAGKRKKISYKAKLFSIAINCSTSAWEVGIKESKKLTISAGISISNLFRLNEDVLTRIYGLNSEDFIKIHKQSQAGVTFNSCKMANTLTRSAISIIEAKYTNKTENI